MKKRVRVKLDFTLASEAALIFRDRIAEACLAATRELFQIKKPASVEVEPGAKFYVVYHPRTKPKGKGK